MEADLDEAEEVGCRDGLCSVARLQCLPQLDDVQLDESVCILQRKGVKIAVGCRANIFPFASGIYVCALHVHEEQLVLIPKVSSI